MYTTHPIFLLYTQMKNNTGLEHITAFCLSFPFPSSSSLSPSLLFSIFMNSNMYIFSFPHPFPPHLSLLLSLLPLPGSDTHTGRSLCRPAQKVPSRVGTNWKKRGHLSRKTIHRLSSTAQLPLVCLRSCVRPTCSVASRKKAGNEKREIQNTPVGHRTAERRLFLLHQ